ncbi:MAG: endonuclease/exonuclease/phosphatase family protein [Oryzihumus sp.]
MQLTRPLLSGLAGILLAAVTAALLVLVPGQATAGTHHARHHVARTHHHRHVHRAHRHHHRRHHVRHHHRRHPRRVTTTFTIATFNILGSQHTVRPGGWGPGSVRARVTAKALERRGIDVMGLQEVQEDQLRVLEHHMHGYRFWPGTRLGYPGVPLQIGWSTWKFRRLHAGWIRTPFDHQHRPVPWVKLRDLRNHRTLYVVDLHNSAGPQERSRDAATGKEVRLIRALRSHHRPVFALGDANEKREFFCKVVGKTDLRAANGGSVRHGRCRAPRHPRIDWILGSGPVRFTHYRHDKGFGVRRASDHDLVRARVVMETVRPRRHARHQHRHQHRHHHRRH